MKKNIEWYLHPKDKDTNQVIGNYKKLKQQHYDELADKKCADTKSRNLWPFDSYEDIRRFIKDSGNNFPPIDFEIFYSRNENPPKKFVPMLRKPYAIVSRAKSMKEHA